MAAGSTTLTTMTYRHRFSNGFDFKTYRAAITSAIDHLVSPLSPNSMRRGSQSRKLCKRQVNKELKAELRVTFYDLKVDLSIASKCNTFTHSVAS